MNELVFLKNRQALTTSLKVAEYFEKRHDNVVQTIEREYEDLPEFGNMFFKATYSDSYGRPQPMYLLTRNGFFMLVSGFTGKKATAARLAFIAAFNTMEKQIINDAFFSLFVEELGRKMAELALHEPNKKCAYVLEMDNGTVKIGVTQDFNRRINEIMNGSGMEVIRYFHTEQMNRRDAFKVETSCHHAFAENRKRGEFFNIDFDDACNEVQRRFLPA